MAQDEGLPVIPVKRDYKPQKKDYDFSSSKHKGGETTGPLGHRRAVWSYLLHIRETVTLCNPSKV